MKKRFYNDKILYNQIAYKASHMRQAFSPALFFQQFFKEMITLFNIQYKDCPSFIDNQYFWNS